MILHERRDHRQNRLTALLKREDKHIAALAAVMVLRAVNKDLPPLAAKDDVYVYAQALRAAADKLEETF